MSIQSQPKLSAAAAKAAPVPAPPAAGNASPGQVELAQRTSRAGHAGALDAATLRNYFRQMVLLREFEGLGEREFRAGLIRGYYHSYAGQEAVGVGIVNNLDLTRDYIVDHYRDHGHCILTGVDPLAVYAELFGRRTGVSKGKGGSMHLFSPEHHFLGGDGIVGGGISVATGVGLGLRLRKQDGVCVCFFGDGAVDVGSFHESLNMASLWGVPTLYVCINNMYSMGTSLARHSSVPELVDRARGYGMAVEQIDGQDIFAVHEASRRLIQTTRERRRPCFIEALTYRYQGHGIHDKALNYRTAEEEARWHGRDPVQLLAEHLVEEKILTTEQIERIRAEVVAELETKIAAAKAAAEPQVSELTEDVTL